MRTKIIALIISTILTTTLTGCFFNIDQIGIVGNGEVVEEVRSLPEFDEIVSSISYDVYYEYGDSFEVRIVCESNLVSYIETSVFDNRLDIRSPFHVTISNFHPIEVYVKSPSISRIVSSGSGDIETCTITEPLLKLEISGSSKMYSAFMGDDLEVKITGSGDTYLNAECQSFIYWNNASGDLTVDGSTGVSKYTIMGSGDVDAFNFPCVEADVSISGSGDLSLNVQDRLNVNLSGSGDLYYVGNPAITQIITGSGDLINKNTNF